MTNGIERADIRCRLNREYSTRVYIPLGTSIKRLHVRGALAGIRAHVSGEPNAIARIRAAGSMRIAKRRHRAMFCASTRETYEYSARVSLSNTLSSITIGDTPTVLFISALRSSATKYAAHLTMRCRARDADTGDSIMSGKSSDSGALSAFKCSDDGRGHFREKQINEFYYYIHRLIDALIVSDRSIIEEDV